MACVYYYKGNLIGNELQLNDFLIERKQFHTKYGDVVFKRSNKANQVIQIIDEKIIPESQTWKFKMDEMWKNGGRLYDDDGEKVIIYDQKHPPFIGVNKYVDRFGAETNERLNAEFKPEEYWTRMFDRWTKGQFTTENAANPNEIVDIIKQVTGEDPTTIPGPLTKNTMEGWRKIIESKWRAQGEIGTAVHAVSEFYFSKTGDSYNFENIDNDVDAAWNTFPNEYKANSRITKEVFVKAVTMCQKLKEDLKKKYGEDCVFYPEISMTCDTLVEVSGSSRIYGIVDLLVVDAKGVPHLLDYKTSTKPYSDFHITKKTAYTYQLAIYERILANYGIRTDESTSTIIPIQIKNMKYDQASQQWLYDDISYNMIEQNQDTVQQETLPQVKSEKVVSNINKFLPTKVKLELQTEHLMENVTKALKVLFPKYQIKRGASDEELIEMLRTEGAFEKNPKTGDYRYQFPYGGDELVVPADDPNPEMAMLRKARAEIDSWTIKKQNLVGRVKNELKSATAEGRSFKFSETYRVDGDPLWLEQTMNQYCNNDWEIVECPGAESFGMLLLQNVNTGLVTVLKLTNSRELTYQHKFDGKSRKNLTGKYEEDVVENSKSNSRMLKAVQGNIELMEAMLVLQNLQLTSNANLNIKEFKLIQPYTQSSLPASNREIMYSFNKLMSLAKKHKEDINLDTSNFTGENPRISLIKPMEDIRIQLKAILRQHTEKHRVLNDYTIKAINDFTDATEVIDPDGLYKELYKLAQKWESEEGYKDAVSVVRTNVKDVLSPEYKLYSDIMIAMADLRNQDVRQQIKDSDKWLENLNVFRDGMEGLYTENPGNFKSQTLNQITSVVSNAFQKIRNSMNARNAKLRQLVKKLKDEKNYGYLQNNLIGNPTKLYENMIEERNGDLVFVNPDTLHGAEREFLEYVLEVINENRHPNDKANFDLWKRTGDLRYYRVPLMRASTASKVTTNGSIKALGDRFRTWTWKGAMQELKERTQGFLTQEEEELSYAKENIFKMNNVFDWGESDKRLDKIKENGGVGAFEHNLEDLLLNHCFAYDLSKEMTKEMPIIKASSIALAVQGTNQNIKGGFANIQEFIEEYVKSKIKSQSINDPKYRKLEGAMGKVRQVASFMSLAYSPLQFTYQMVEHIWKSISLIIRKPDGTDAFTLKNMWNSLKSVYRQLGHFSDEPSQLQLINETYGINDMDSRQLANRLSSNQGFLTNMEDWAFRMASRADFYSRMSIFEAQMRKDGSLDAHVKVDGALVYDYKKDKRYEAMFIHPAGSKEYNEAYARYLAAAKQFQEEGVLKADGTEFQIGDALPQAYTNKEASSMKAIADNIYGYYNNETKSMMSSILLGGLLTQMKTYWSAKKNQYLAPGGVKLIGHFEDYKEKDSDGVEHQLYYQKNAKGEIDINAPLVRENDPNCSQVKAQRWKGQWQEGIMATLWKLGAGAVEGRFREEWDELWNNPDDNLRLAYRSNIKQLAYDLLILCVIGNLTSYCLGDWADDEEDEWRKDKGDQAKAMDYMMANFIYKTFDNSFRDFNMVASIWDPMLDWQPFAFNTLWTNASRMWDAAVGDSSFSRSILQSFSAGRLVTPMFDSLTYEE